MTKPTRAARIINWIENYCVVPDGPNRGLRVKLVNAQRMQIRAIYDATGEPEPVVSPLSAYLALLHTCGIEAKSEMPAIEPVDCFTVWRAASDEVKEYLCRDGEHIVCPELGTSYPRRAA